MMSYSSLLLWTCLCGRALSFQSLLPRFSTPVAHPKGLSASTSEPSGVLDFTPPLVTDFFSQFLSNTPSQESDVVAVAAKGNWRAYIDVESTGLIYYHNVKSGVSQWNPPARFPAIKLTVSEQRLSEKLQKQYQQSISSRNSFLSSISAFLLAFLESLFKSMLDTIYESLPKVPLASEGSWQAFMERSTDTVYYYNTVTDESQWTPPTLTFPKVGTKAFAAEDVQEDELLSVSGDWKVYFDTTEALIYYTNEMSGVRTWEPPVDVVVPQLTSKQLDQIAMKRQSLQQDFNLLESVVSTTEAVQHAMKEVDIVQTVWGTVSDNIALHASRSMDQAGKNLGEMAKNSLHYWMDNAASLVNRDFSPTRAVEADPKKKSVLSALFEENEADDDDDSNIMMDPWIEKRYADSDARQANLRKNYDSVVTDRSPTISLSAMKRSDHKDWFKYLGD